MIRAVDTWCNSVDAAPNLTGQGGTLKLTTRLIVIVTIVVTLTDVIEYLHLKKN
jgi:hypothetical protein